jgi:oxygen-independent coproporphyrinogen-3 oxidase
MLASFYIHWPFCESKCPYCDFNSHVRDHIDHDAWLNAYVTEINYYINIFGENRPEISSIFFGGGTPSLMKASQIEKILDVISKNFKVNKNIEITLEANPSSFETNKFKDFKNAGINRVSIGVQSFNETYLKFLGRKHDKSQAIFAIENAKKIFGNFSFDLIYALPNQNLDDWKNQLNFALSFDSPHISLYQLTIEKGTPFYSDFINKKFELPEESIQTDLYLYTVEKCLEHNLFRYEISNFSKQNFESKHNLNYWNYGDYIGIGAGAHGRLNFLESEKLLKYSTVNIHSPENWLKSVEANNHGIQNKELMGNNEILEEIIFMGLRIKIGILLSKLQKIGLDIEKNQKLLSFFNKLKEEGLMEFNTEYLKLTDKGLLLHNNICRRIFNLL